MLKAIIILFVLGSTIQARSTPYKLFSDEHIKFINSQASTWVAGKNFDENTTISTIQRLLGAKKSPKSSLKYKAHVVVEDGTIPETFDAREHWPKCRSIKLIRDQSACGSCWAIAAVSAISDRICIASDSKKQTLISADDLISCCGFTCGYGCEGGFPLFGWNFWVTHGLVSGGEYGSGEGCKPYPFPQCEHHTNATRYRKCSSDDYDTPDCLNKCTNSKITYENDLNRGKEYYAVESDVEQIQTEIMTRGPVEASFDVYDDFPSYKSGVYQKTPGSEQLGGHAVRIIGWGIEKGIPFWSVTNSWNEDWGQNGLFKIRRGSNECSIEDEILAGTPDLSNNY